MKPLTPNLDKYLGVEEVNKAKELSKETRRLSYELNQIYGRQRILRKFVSTLR